MFRAIISLFTVLIMLLSVHGLADDSYRNQFAFGGDLGLGRVELQRASNSSSNTWFYGALRAEYVTLNRLHLGIEGAGWTDSGGSSSSITEDILSVMVTARRFPFQDPDVYLKLGWGYSKHRYWESPSPGDTSGDSFIIGFGYYPGFRISYSKGDLDHESYQALTLSLGATF